MDPFSLEPPGSPLRPSWIEFCDKHANSASEDFFAGFLVYLKAHPTSEFRPREPIDFAKKFVELFLRYFERKLSTDNGEGENNGSVVDGCLAQGGGGNFSDNNSEVNGFIGQGAISASNSSIHAHHNHFNDNSTYPEADPTSSTFTSSHNSSHSSPAIKSKGSILKRFSFRKIKQRNLFKQNSDEMELASGSSDSYSKEKHLSDQKHMKRSKKLQKESKHKLAPITAHASGEIKKEGIVFMFSGEDSKGKSRWEKTRLVLFKSESDYLLEFYCPPKVCIPGNIIFHQFVVHNLAVLYPLLLLLCIQRKGVLYSPHSVDFTFYT